MCRFKNTMKIRNYMRKRKASKVLMVTVLLAFVLHLSGCGIWSAVDEGLKANKRRSDDKYWTDRNVPPVDLDLDVLYVAKAENLDTDIRVSRCVYKCLEDGNKQMLKKMFAASVIEGYAALDKDLDALFDYYDDLKVDEYTVESNSYYRTHKVDPPVNIVEYTFHTSFYYAEEEYILDIMYVTDSLPNKDLLGIHGIRLRNRDTNESVVVHTIHTDI